MSDFFDLWPVQVRMDRPCCPVPQRGRRGRPDVLAHAPFRLPPLRASRAMGKHRYTVRRIETAEIHGADAQNHHNQRRRRSLTAWRRSSNRGPPVLRSRSPGRKTVSHRPASRMPELPWQWRSPGAPPQPCPNCLGYVDLHRHHDGMGFSETCSICTGTGSVVELILASTYLYMWCLLGSSKTSSCTPEPEPEAPEMVGWHAPGSPIRRLHQPRTPRRSSARRPLAAAST